MHPTPCGVSAARGDAILRAVWDGAHKLPAIQPTPSAANSVRIHRASLSRRFSGIALKPPAYFGEQPQGPCKIAEKVNGGFIEYFSPHFRHAYRFHVAAR